MRVVKKIVFLVFLLIGVSVSSQNIVTPQADSLVNISKSGLITDFKSGDTLGQITSTEIKNASGQVIGQINGVNIKDASGTTLCKVNNSVNNKTGLKNDNDIEIGTIGSSMMLFIDGEFILNSSEPIDPKWLTAYYLFFYNK